MTLLIQNSTGKLVVSLETTGGTPATGLETSAVQVDLKKSDETFFTNKVLTAPVLATAAIGAGANGTVDLTVLGGAIGNTYTVEVTVPGGTAPLTVTKAGSVLTIDLSVSTGTPVGVENTATLIADAINALSGEISAVASGTGVDSLSSAEGPTSFAGGSDGDFTELGGGSYQLDLAAGDTDTLGELFVRVSGGTIRTVVLCATVATAVAATPTPSLSVPTTVIYGYIKNIDDSPASGVSLAVKVLSTPTVLHQSSEGFAVSTELLTATTDSQGFFTISLVTGSQVDIFIPAVSYRRTLTVPAISSNLFDIP